MRITCLQLLSRHLDKFSTSHTLVSSLSSLHAGRTPTRLSQPGTPGYFPSIHLNSFISGRTRAPLPRLFILTSRSKGLLEKIRWLGETLKGKINSIWTIEPKGLFSLISSKRTFEYICTFARILKRLPLSLLIHVSGVNHHQGLLQCKAMRSEAWKTHLRWLNCNCGAEFPPNRSPSSCKAPGKHDEEQYYP